MSIPNHAVSVEVDIPFSHCDPMKVVWHGRYLEYLELARTRLLRSIDLDADALERLGLRTFVVDLRCRYLASLSYGDVARVTAWFSEGRPHIRIAYLIDNLTQGRRSARAHTVIATTDAAGRLFPETPDALISRLPSA